MKILAIGNCPLNPLTGSGQTRLAWSEGLRRYGHRVDILEPRDFELLPGWPGSKFRQAAGAWRTVRHLPWREYDLVEMFGDENWLLASWLRRRHPRPLLVAHTDGLELLADACHQTFLPSPGFWREAWNNATHRRLSRLAFTAADALVCGCRADGDYAVHNGFFSSPAVAVISPGLRPVFHGRPRRGGRPGQVAFAGSWLPLKGTGRVVEVMSRVLRSHSTARLVILGSQAGSEMILPCFPADVRSRITVYPVLAPERVIEELEQSAVFFFPSIYEGFGLVLGEAMACGCACVTTPTGLGSDLRRGIEGLVRSYHDADGMAEDILRLLGDADLLEKLSASGWQRAQTLRWEDSVRKLEQVYRNWVGARGSGAPVTA